MLPKTPHSSSANESVAFYDPFNSNHSSVPFFFFMSSQMVKERFASRLWAFYDASVASHTDLLGHNGACASLRCALHTQTPVQKRTEDKMVSISGQRQ